MGGYDAIVEGYQADALPPEIMAILKESAGKLVVSIPDATAASAAIDILIEMEREAAPESPSEEVVQASTPFE